MGSTRQDRDEQQDEDRSTAEPAGDEATDRQPATRVPPQDAEPAGAPPRPEFATDEAPKTKRNSPPPVAPIAAVGAWVVAAAAGAVALVLSVLGLGELRTGLAQNVNQQEFNVSQSTIETVITGLLYSTLIAVGLTSALFLLLAAGVWARRNWARVLLVAVAVLNLPVVLVALGVVSQTAWIALSVQVALTVVAVVVMFLPPVNAWVRARGRASA